LVFEPGGTTEARCSDKGVFSYQGTNDFGPVMRLIAYLPGYRPLHVDLTAAGASSRGLALRLEKQQYGGVAVTVCDTEGKPLKSAAVAAQPGGYSARFRQSGGTRTGTTDKAGRAVLKSLACGKRQFMAVRDGYYLEKPVEAEVVADKVTSVTIALRRGVTLQGTVEAPAGVDRTKALVQLFRENTDTAFGNGYQYCALTAAADAQGRFEFSGLAPGKIRLSVQCPGMVAAEESSAIELTEKTAAVSLKLVPAGGFSVDLGPAARGMGLYLIAPGAWDPARPATSPRLQPGVATLPQYFYPEHTADSEGHGEVYGVRPGLYDLLLIPRDEWFHEQDRTNCVVSRVIPGVSVAPPPGGPDKLEPLRAPSRGMGLLAHESGGRVTGRIVLKGPADWREDERALGWLRLAVVGDSAVGNCTFALPDALDPKRVPVVVGKPPEGFRLDGPGEFTVSGLPGGGGEYRVYVAYPSYEKQRGAWDTQWVVVGGAPMRVFRVADGQTVHLGDIPLELPPSLREQMRRQRREQNEWLTRQSFGSDIGEDAEPAFQP
ncbi:MAG: carboxypeptidase-like regulatory domain-containing protein, partial [Planctomycetota bacterium]|nr:carboxypeptidase-like regulatory domain-containing protein [Planctomycetota bacterium]